ncbi:hypothetical protein O9929_15560 [Vibrio lentus]|nr:hypothetical protein [Vibrio lentus]
MPTKHFRGKVLFEKAHKSLTVQPQISGLGAIDGADSIASVLVNFTILKVSFAPSIDAIQYQVDVLLFLVS